MLGPHRSLSMRRRAGIDQKRIRMLMATPSGRVGLVGLAVLVFLALFAPLIWGDAAETIDTAAMLQGPTGEHPAGTDGLGRDVMARVLVATRPSLWYRAAGDGVGVGAGDHPRGAPVGGRPPRRPGPHGCWSTCWWPSRD